MKIYVGIYILCILVVNIWSITENHSLRYDIRVSRGSMSKQGGMLLIRSSLLALRTLSGNILNWNPKSCSTISRFAGFS